MPFFQRMGLEPWNFSPSWVVFHPSQSRVINFAHCKVHIANLYNLREKYMLTGRETIKPSWPSIHLFYYSFKGKQGLHGYGLCVATCMWHTHIPKLCAHLWAVCPLTEQLLHWFPDSNQI